GDERDAGVLRVVAQRDARPPHEGARAGRLRAAEAVRREDGPEPRSRRERAAELDEEQHLLGEVVARAAARLRKTEPEPPELRRRAPERVIRRRLVADELPHARD